MPFMEEALDWPLSRVLPIIQKRIMEGTWVADSFETIVALNSLYDKLSPGGYVIVDDYHVVPGCKGSTISLLLIKSLPNCVKSVALECTGKQEA
jgi:hypothetical protein